MARRLATSFSLLLLVSVTRTPVCAADQVVPGARLRLEQSASGDSLVLVLSSPSLQVPTAGSADDPALNAGMRIVLFGHSFPGEIAELIVPPGLGRPGWSASATTPTRYRYRNSGAPAGPSPVRWATLRQGRLRVVARAAGLALSGPQGSVGVRVEIGPNTICTVFAGAAVRRDEVGTFFTRGAPTPGLMDCGSEGLFGTPCEASSLCGGLCPDGSQCAGFPGFAPCTCISSSGPCGDTAPVCSGQCPAGEVCSDVGGAPFNSCSCLPEGSVGCGMVYPTCGDGDCPPGLGCYLVTFTCCGGATISNCGCLSAPPTPPCGGPCPPGSLCLGPAPGFPQACYPQACSASSCPPGSTCEDFGGGALYCQPIVCSGGSGYPTCDGTCDPGLSCQGFPQGTGACCCAP